MEKCLTTQWVLTILRQNLCRPADPQAHPADDMTKPPKQVAHISRRVASNMSPRMLPERLTFPGLLGCLDVLFIASGDDWWESA